MRVLHGADAVLAAVGTELGASDYRTIDQGEVNAFADLTGDHQWIHIDVDRARDSPFGSTIVHGFFTLALLPRLLAEVYDFQGFAFGVNYGLNRVRFPAPLPVGARVRARATLTSVDPVPGGLQTIVENVVELDGANKPACVAELIVRLYTSAPDQEDR